MRALITGAGGQLGRALAGTAPEAAEVHALDRSRLDIADVEAIRRLVAELRPDLILNAAAHTAVDRAESEPDLAFALNARAPAVLAEAAAAVGARLVHVSTDFVFDGTGGRPYTPEDPAAPLGVYGASKLAGEEAVRAALPHALIVRTAWVYAAGGRNFVQTMLRLMAERPEVRVVADQLGTPTHARSLARALWGLVAAGATGLHHFTDAGAASWYDFAVAIGEEARAIGLLSAEPRVIPIATADYPTPARRPSYGLLDKTSSWRLLGGPGRHWLEELRSMLAELKDG